MIKGRKWLMIGSATGLLLIAILVIVLKPTVPGFGKKPDQPVSDSLAMIEQLTPEIGNLSTSIHEDPTNPGLYFARANAYFDYGNLKYALADFEKAYRIDSTNPAHVLGFSDCLFFLNNAEGAIAVLEDYRLHDPNDLDVLVTLAVDYYKLPKPQMQKSIDLLNEALKLDIQHADAYFYKGMIYKESGDTAKAISNFQTTVEVDPDFYDAYMQLGLLYAANKNSLALQYLNNALALDSTSREAHYAIAKYYQDIGKMSTAINYYKSLITDNPQDADAIYNLATIYYGIDSVKAAYRYYDLAIKQSPAKAMCYYGKGLCAEELKNIKEAISLYTQALNLDPDLVLAEEKLKQLNAE